MPWRMTSVDPDDVHCETRSEDFTDPTDPLKRNDGIFAALRRRLRLPADAGIGIIIAHLERLADYAFCSFERTLLFLAAGGEWSTTWLALLNDYAADLGIFEGLPRAMFGPPRLAQAHLVMAACRWRLTVAAMYRSWILPARRTGDPHWNHLLSLFGATHLELMTCAAERAEAGLRVDDAYFLQETTSPDAPAPLTVLYPLPHRVLCGDELPDLSAPLMASDLFIDMNKLKPLMTYERWVVHIFVIKQLPHICNVRHLPDTIAKASARYPDVRALLRVVVETALQGLFAHQQRAELDVDPIGWAQRIRVHRALSPRVTDDAALGTWMTARVYVLFFALREWLLDQVAQHPVLERLLGQNTVKWADFKAISHQTMHELNVALDAQARTAGGGGGIMSPFVWQGLTSDETNKSTAARTKIGTITSPSHNFFLETCTKLQKGSARQIIVKKLVAEKMVVLRHHIKRTLARIPALHAFYVHLCRQDDACTFATAAALCEADFLGIRTAASDFVEAVLLPRLRKARVALTPRAPSVAALFIEAVLAHYLLEPLRARLAAVAVPLRLAAMDAAREEKRRPGRSTPLRYLQMLGMSERGFAEVRSWFERYAFLEQSDDGYKRWTLMLGAASLYDHTIFELYMREVEHFSREGVFFLPMDYFDRQTSFLLARLHVDKDAAPPRELARALYCDSCGKFATIMQATPLWVANEYDRYFMGHAMRRLRAFNKDHPLMTPDFVFKMVPVGQSAASLDGVTGKRFCPRMPLAKDQLKRQKVLDVLQQHAPAAAVERPAAAQAAAAAAPGPDDGVADDRDDGVVELDDADAAADVDALEARELIASRTAATEAAGTRARVGHSGAALELGGVDEDNGEARRRRRHHVGDPAMDDEDEEADADADADADDEDEDERAAVGARGKRQREPWRLYRMARNARYRAMMNAMYVDAGLRAISPLGNTCGTSDLVNIDLRGAIYYRHGEAHAFCCYCGDLTRVTALKWRRHGISCMNHPHVDEFALDSFPTAAFRSLIETTIAARTQDFCQPTRNTAARVQEEYASVLGSWIQRTLYPHPQVLDTKVPCAWCQKARTRKVIHALDPRRGIVELALCNADLETLHDMLNTARLGLKGAPLTVFADVAAIRETLMRAEKAAARAHAADDARKAAAAARQTEARLDATVRLAQLQQTVALYTAAEQREVRDCVPLLDAALDAVVAASGTDDIFAYVATYTDYVQHLASAFGERRV